MSTCAIGLLPWGFMDEELCEEMRLHPVPSDWQVPHDQWGQWLESVVRELAASLWPIYRAGSSDWETAAVSALNAKDFGLLADLHEHLLTPIIAAFPSTVTHETFFKEEDDDRGFFGAGYERYDSRLGASACKELIDALDAGIYNKVGTLDLQLKHILQRPRPWQVAFMQGKTDYPYRLARSAYTPSMISGHCLSGVMAGTTASILMAASLPPSSIEVLQQFTVDIGDRRVFAGIHYPSDSLSSFYTAFRLIPLVFAQEVEAAARAFLWEAVNSRSVVFAAVRDDIRESGAASPYARIVAAIEDAALK